MLTNCHFELEKRKASGVDGVTKEEYGHNLLQNVRDLVEQMKRQAYKPQPVKRAYIPKPGTDKTRPLGIPAYEDKLVQKALSKILNSIYEAEFLDCSFGFRPNRGCHDALKVLNRIIETKNTNYSITDNYPMVDKFRNEVRRLLFKWLNRRSQRRSFDWDKFVLFLKRYPIPRPKTHVNIYNLKTEIGYIL